MKKLIILIFVIFISLNLANAQILPEMEKVKEIKLLESNRDKIRVLLANFNHNYEDSEHQDTFYTDKSEIEVYYSKGFCSEDSEEWDLNISEWNVAAIKIHPKISITLKDLRLNTAKYKKEKMFKNDSDLFVYHNKETGIVLQVRKNIIEDIIFNPPRKFYSFLCDKEQAKILLSTKSLFTRKLKEREIIIDTVAFVQDIELSNTAIYYSCSELKQEQNKSISKNNAVVKVHALVNYSEDDVLTYAYTVSGGKIIGTGAKVIWDLSCVKPGTYTITASVDDGCGFCGPFKSKTVTVKNVQTASKISLGYMKGIENTRIGDF